MTSEEEFRESFASVEVSADFTFAVLTMRDGSRLSFCHRVGERWARAVGAGDAKTFDAVFTELKLQPRFCIQLCHWLCFLRCRRFCILVCPPPGLLPVFTAIGQFAYLTDIASGVGGTGLTIGATPNYAFFWMSSV